MQQRIKIIVAGKVQGVFFRASAKKQADLLGVRGFARNLPDGRVEIVAEGEQQALLQFLDWCRRGPMMARVNDVSVGETQNGGQFSGFDIR